MFQDIQRAGGSDLARQRDLNNQVYLEHIERLRREHPGKHIIISLGQIFIGDTDLDVWLKARDERARSRIYIDIPPQG